MRDRPSGFSVQFVVIADDAIDAAELMRSRFHDLVTVLLALGIALGIVYTLLDHPSAGLAIAFGCAAILVLTRIRARTRWLTERQSRSVLGIRQLIVITEKGLQYESPIARGEMPWATITEVRESDRTVVFVRDRLLISFTPTSGFASPTVRERFVSYARARIAASRAARAR